MTQGRATHATADVEQVWLARAWLRAFCRPRLTLNRVWGSYSLKHRAESWANVYLTEQSFLTAAAREGYRARQKRPGSTHFYLNVSVVRPWNRKGERR